MAETKKQEILRVAEQLARKGGYNNFSYREIAKLVGIKSSSVHYYFQGKEELGRALAETYRINFFKSLNKSIADDCSPRERVRNQFRYALKTQNRMCLCGILGAEVDNLPEAVAGEVKNFYTDLEDWLAQAYAEESCLSKREARKLAQKEIALLEGGLILAKVFNNKELFENILSD